MPRGVRRSLEVREHDAVAWTTARKSGISVEAIAAESGAAPATVSRATSGGGPFPGARTSSETAAKWARQRLDGEAVRDIAAQAGVSPTTAYVATRPYGPFRRMHAENDAMAREWADLRATGVSLARISRRYGVGTSTIAKVTNGFGPFPAPTRGSNDTLSLRGVSRLSGVSVPALRRRVANGDLPAPAGYGPRGWRFWLKADIISWLDASDLEECRLCGARFKSIGWHLVSRHGLDTAQYRTVPPEVR